MKNIFLALLIVGGFSQSAWAAWAEVAGQRATGQGNGDLVDVPFPANVTSGNLLVVAGAAFVPPATITVTGAGAGCSGTTFTAVLSAAWGETSTMKTFVAYLVAPATGACTVRVNPEGASTDFSYSIDEFSGSHATPASVSGGLTTGTGTAVTTSIATAVADELIIAVMSFDDPSSYTMVPSGTVCNGGAYTQIGEQEDGTIYGPHNAAFCIVTTAAIYTPTWTLGTSDQWGAQSHSFKPSVAGGPTISPQLLLLGVGP